MAAPKCSCDTYNSAGFKNCCSTAGELRAEKERLKAELEVEKELFSNLMDNFARVVGERNRGQEELAALRQSQQAGEPKGWKLVPLEPTPEMLDAMRSSGWLPGSYRAMLAAAPQPSQPNDGDAFNALVEKHVRRIESCFSREEVKACVTLILAQDRTPQPSQPSEDAGDARPTLEQERAEAERQYMTGAFDYGTAPIGSRDWCLYWSGWLARSTAAMQKGGA